MHNNLDSIVAQGRAKQKEQMSAKEIDETDPAPSDVTSPGVTLASNYRALSAPLNSNIRQDLPPLMSAFIKTLAEDNFTASEYKRGTDRIY
ncbi:hypothetical protein MFLAVUS_008284 [Mucor flavus]|uniref:Uncharacterized protein n=1 Tax=Mucor flavus TaxID=439312 RepID=A0ABP9Z6T8_9FUNG